MPPRPLGGGEHAGHGSHPAVERQLSDRGMPAKTLLRHLPRSRQHGERDRQVVARSLLPQLRRREIDGDATAGPLQLCGHDPAAHPLLRLLTGTVRKADDRECGGAVLEVRLDFDPARLEPDESMRDGACEHAADASETAVSGSLRLCAGRVKPADEDVLEEFAGPPAGSPVHVTAVPALEREAGALQNLWIELPTIVDHDHDRSPRP